MYFQTEDVFPNPGNDSIFFTICIYLGRWGSVPVVCDVTVTYCNCAFVHLMVPVLYHAYHCLSP